MNRAAVDRIADAVLYEGYILYPYRPSVKNRQRWTFGGLYPEAYCAAKNTGDASSSQTECLIAGGETTRFEAVVRFLHLTARQVGAFDVPRANGSEAASARLVESLMVGSRMYQTWQEAEEREVDVAEATIAELLAGPLTLTFAFAGNRRSEPIADEAGVIVGMLSREQKPIEGAVELSAATAGDGLYRVTLRIVNRTPLADPVQVSRDDGLLQSLVSAHAILGVRDGAFVSLMDPPDAWREAAAACRNIGTWPVLAGPEGQNDMMLSSPIILYDHPQVAPESPGDFFDGTEIDEMLTLRVLTLTDDEKRAMAAVDERAGALLARTEAQAREHLLNLHGTIRGLRPVAGEESRG